MKKVQVLLSTYNGERFLEEQLQSLAAQKGVELSVLVRDDGSSDSTTKILDKWQKTGLLQWYQGENMGPAKSFLNLMQHAPDADYYAFCDQDDVWLDCKLQKAAEKLDAFEAEKPAMYFSKAQLVDAELHQLKRKVKDGYVFSFGQALIRNNAIGCTMVFNRTLLELINGYAPSFVPMHDYCLYLVCLALDGNVIYDSNSCIMYRQHGENIVGNTISGRGALKRKIRLLFGNKQPRLRTASSLFCGYNSRMSQQHRDILCVFINYKVSYLNRLRLVNNETIKDKSLVYNISFVFAVLFGVV